MKRLSVLLLFAAAVLLGACTTEAQWTKKMHYVYPNDARYDYDIPFADP